MQSAGGAFRLQLFRHAAAWVRVRAAFGLRVVVFSASRSAGIVRGFPRVSLRAINTFTPMVTTSPTA